MALEDVKDSVPEQDETVGKTNVRLDEQPVNELKKEAGVSQNTEAAPLVEAAIYEYIGDSESASESEDKFEEQFEE